MGRFALSLVLALPLLGQQPWLYSEPVTLRGNFGASDDLTLTNGHDVRLVSDPKIRAITSKWAEGMPLQLVYAIDKGLGLLDPQTDTFVPAILTDGDLPIDILEKRCFDAPSAQTTQGMVECADQGNRMWEAEIQRVYALLFARLNAEQRAALQAAQEKWVQFFEAQLAANALINTGGTMSRIDRSMAAEQLRGERWAKLATLYVDSLRASER